MITKHKIIIGDSRKMSEIDDSSVHLIVTSPPYWQLKDYGSKNQIGFNDIATIRMTKKRWIKCRL